ncbi:MAG: DUF481 domain-containing protein [Gemmatimonadota bacterium]
MLTACASAAPATLGAQGPDDGADEPESVTGDASFGLTVTEGNSETLSMNVGGKLAYRADYHTWSLSTGVLRTHDGDELKANRGNVTFRYDFEPSEQVYVTSKVAASYNRPAGIERRLAPGLGLGYDVLRGDDSRLSVDAGFNWVGERFADDTRESSLYFNVAQEFRLRVNETTDLEQRLAYSPRSEDLGDYLVHTSVTLTTSIWKTLGLKTQISDDYDSTPFVDPETGEARGRNDFTFITGLNVTF